MADQQQKDTPTSGAPSTHGQAAVAHGKKDTHWQKLADHTKAMVDKMNEILQDPKSTDDEKTEAQETIDAMQKIQFRLQNKYGVSPSGTATV
jgi:hypothetical protein